ncbi:MAG: hypothetical protein GIX03_01975 [Candidatus Eremiobacteraeota bacterium]|nr:hypothetical protein [Candidatus Eremiobacteraeota bacterium]MBC5801786.1 hypothetical protein [Candidatus Eremiobacteraeota bacterium]MBC5823149.1 hypothetical protein [Candidatus Eremiobacteraeota bacterium]
MESVEFVSVLWACGIGVCAAASPTATTSDFVVEPPHVSEQPTQRGEIDESWDNAARVQLAWDFTYQREARQRTTAYFQVDPTGIDVAFVAHQEKPITATQHTNYQGAGLDDQVTLYLWPGGANGFEYSFSANPLGTRFATSSQSATYAPDFTAAGRIEGDSYTVTMHVPFSILRVNGNKPWRIQFGRTVVLSREHFEWAHSPKQTAVDDVIRAGYAREVRFTKAAGAAAAMVPSPSLQVYGLGQAATRSGGGARLPFGGTLSYPVSGGTSLLATVDPDGSGVETFQNVTAPTVFALTVSEVRPFFAQTGSLFLDPVQCILCSLAFLATPSIPAPHEAFGVTGKQGDYSFSGFGTHGLGRHDDAQLVTYSNIEKSLSATALRTNAVSPAGENDTAVVGISGTNPRSNLFAYANYGSTPGASVQDPSQSKYAELGAGIRGPKTFVGAVVRKIGLSFAPVDGSLSLPTAGGSGSVPLPISRGGGDVSTPIAATNGSVPIVISGLNGSVTVPDVAGYGLNANQQLNFLPTSGIQNITLAGTIQRYHATNGKLDEADNVAQVGVTTRNHLSASLSTGSQYTGLRGGVLRPFNQQGLGLGYLNGTATPTDVFYSAGRYADGYLSSWVRRTLFRQGSRGTVVIELDDQHYRGNGGTLATQWLQRVAYANQVTSSESVAVGLMRRAGIAPPALGTTTVSRSAIDGLNLDVAFYRRSSRGEVYFALGNPTLLTTAPVILLKVIHYFGPVRGT